MILFTLKKHGTETGDGVVSGGECETRKNQN